MDNNDEEIKEYESPYLRHEQKNSKEESSFMKHLFITIIIFAGILLGVFILADNQSFLTKHFGSDSFITQTFIKIAKSSKNKSEFQLPFGLRRQNILFLGIDANEPGTDLWRGTRSDTIIVINIDPKTKSINAISVPRDSKVYLPNDNGINKINSAHAIGGVEMTKKTIEDTLGIKIDKYIVVHDEAVREIVEAMGGIDLYVEKDMRYDDNAGNLHIHLQKGDNHLDPDEAVGYLRFRHDAMGDIGRTQRQQWFIRAMMNQLKDPKNIAKIPEIAAVAKKYVKTDMSLYEMTQYAGLIKHLDLDKAEIATLPGAPNKRGYVSYWILDPEKTQEVVNRLVYRDKAAIDEKNHFSAGVMYAKENEESAQALATELEALGIDVACKSPVSKTHSQFVSHSDKITSDYYVWLKKKAPDISGMQFVYDPINYYCGQTDFTVVLAGK